MGGSVVQAHEGTFEAGGSTRFERRWLPESAVKASVAIVHGYAEHSGRYDHVGRALAEAGYAVYALDLRGHGLSDGTRAYVRSFTEYLDDVRAFLARVRREAPGRPLFLLGHSMGGGIVALACVTGVARGVDGVLLSGAVLPTGGNAGIMSRVIVALGQVAPRLPLIKLKAADVSRDAETVRMYDADPLVYRGRIRAGLAAATTRAVRYIDRHADRIEQPLLVMHGLADALASPDSSRRLSERASSRDRTLKLYDGLYHEILNEPERARVIADIVAWLDERVFGAAK